MSIRRSVTLTFCALFLANPWSPARAADVLPESLLSPTTQIYYRWDGVAAHKTAYAESARGKMLAGDTGKSLAALYEQALRFFGTKAFGEPILKGDAPDSLADLYADFRQADKMPRLLADSGIVAGFEVRPPALRFDALSKLIGLGAGKNDQSVVGVDVQLTVIVPNAAGRPELEALARMTANGKEKPIEVRHMGRIAHEVVIDDAHIAWWPEGKHFVIVVGNVPVRTAISRMANAGDGITTHPLYKQLAAKQSFEVVSRMFADGDSLNRVAKALLTLSGIGPLAALPDVTGLSGLKAVRMWEGFQGDESQGITEIDIVGPREGLTKLCKPGSFDLKDLPKMPADSTRWSAAVFDPQAVYELLLDIAAVQFALFVERGKPFLEVRNQVAEMVDGALGMKVADLIATLGDVGLTYQAPGDGLLAAGQVLAIKVKDAAQFKRQFALFAHGLEKLGRNELAGKRRAYEGIEVREFTAKKGGSVVRPTVAVCDGWVVMALYPQPVQGFILRSKGKLPAWTPDERTAKTLAAIPPGPACIQYADPRPSLKLILGAGQPFASFVTGSLGGDHVFDAGLLPNPDEACRHLFPNVIWSHNDGKTLRWHTRESLAMPGEAVGIEAYILASMASGIR